MAGSCLLVFCFVVSTKEKSACQRRLVLNPSPMKAMQYIFYIGACLDFVGLLVVVFSMKDILNLPAEATGIALLYIGGIFLLLAAIAGLAFWLKNKGKLLLASLVIWIPAVPFVLVAGFALLFIIHDIFK